MLEILMMATFIAPVTSALVQAIKKTKHIPKRYLPLVAFVVGIGLGASATFLDTDLSLRMWAGGISGLAATGLFEISKNGRNE